MARLNGCGLPPDLPRSECRAGFMLLKSGSERGQRGGVVRAAGGVRDSCGGWRSRPCLGPDSAGVGEGALDHGGDAGALGRTSAGRGPRRGTNPKSAPRRRSPARRRPAGGAARRDSRSTGRRRSLAPRRRRRRAPPPRRGCRRAGPAGDRRRTGPAPRPPGTAPAGRARSPGRPRDRWPTPPPPSCPPRSRRSRSPAGLHDRHSRPRRTPRRRPSTRAARRPARAAPRPPGSAGSAAGGAGRAATRPAARASTSGPSRRTSAATVNSTAPDVGDLTSTTVLPRAGPRGAAASAAVPATVDRRPRRGGPAVERRRVAAAARRRGAGARRTPERRSRSGSAGTAGSRHRPAPSRSTAPRSSSGRASQPRHGGRSLRSDLVRPHLHPLQHGPAERGHHRHVERVTATPDQDPTLARLVVARVEGEPGAVQVHLDPGGEVHRLVHRPAPRSPAGSRTRSEPGCSARGRS